MIDIPFAKEQTFDVPGCALDGRPQARQVRMYVKGPTKGVDPATRVVVNLHGAGGRQLNIDYKRFRHEVSDACNCVVLGIDFFGTRSRWVDPLYLSKEKERAIASIQCNLPSFDTTGLVDKRGHAYVDPSRGWYCDSQYAADQCELNAPEDAWDFGFIQALDVLSAVRFFLSAWERLSLPLPPIHFVSRSAGSQISAMCMSLCPTLACSIANIAPLMMSRQQKRIMEILMTNTWGDIQSPHHSSLNLECQGKMTHVLRKVPVLFPAGVQGIPSLEDHVEMRLLDNPALWNGVALKTEIVSWRGTHDHHMPRESLESVHALMTAAGASCHIREVTDNMVDGTLFTSATHDLISDMRAVFMNLKEHILIGDRRPSPPVTWSERTIQSLHGRWRIMWNPSPHFFFER